MSLFKAREWWHATVSEEEFDNGNLCIGNICNDAMCEQSIEI